MMDRMKNILFIMTDQHVWNGIGKLCDWVKTPPNLDRLSQRGVTFRNCYTASPPLCMPARVSLATGLYLIIRGGCGITVNTV